jgi:hypothetical protein
MGKYADAIMREQKNIPLVNLNCGKKYIFLLKKLKIFKLKIIQIYYFNFLH